MRLLLVLFAVFDVTRAGSCNIRFDTISIYYGEKRVNQYVCVKVTPADLTQDSFFPVSYPVFTANDSHLLSVYKEMFANMGKHYLEIKVLAMVNSHIRNISEDAFDKFVGLSYLDLRHNDITEIGFLKTIISRLQTVDLSYNKIEHVSVINMSHPRNLNKLNLAFNKIITVDFGFVPNATALNALDLSHNLLENLSEGVFRSLPYVGEVYLTNCTRRKLDFRIFESTTRLRVLNVSHNDVLLPQLPSLPQLSSLNLSATKVAIDQEMFIASRRLQHLDLSSNGFKNLEKSVFIHLQDLESLHLHHNDLESLEQDMFKGLNKTLLLNCSSNRIKSLQPNVFVELVSLRSLDLARNGLVKIETGAFHSLPELRFLDLSENAIETLHEMTFKGLNLLLELHLNGNRVKSLVWCQTYFHTKCVKVSDDEVKFINSKKNFNWFCDPCAIHESHSLRNILTNINKVTMNWDRVMESQHEKLMNHEKLLKDTLDQVNTQNVSISKDLAQVLQTQSEVKLTYADKLKQKTYDPVIIVKPKDANQPSKQTFTTLKENIGSNYPRKAAAKLKEEAETKLGSDYILSLPKQKMPKIKIVGLNDKIGSTQMKEMILAQNQFLDEAAYINVVHITEDKTNPNRYLAYAEVDGNSYRKILSEQKLNIGWDRCRIYDAVTTRRCYKCNGFGHKATDCSKTTTCPKCAGAHDLASCKASDAEIKCSNCANAVEKLKMKLDVQHPAYKKRLDQERSRIDFLGHPQH
ncbi:uncharacterized protein LOC116180095 [Photinus pyralis]|uniref:uncharacterized protein LOC116180095 n=1 Tax=Photinus pyralis TaxID=7054 RepID=UPI0012670989|nr:uncharacterized protein LOC116180095 [Photinus pyralis]